MRHFYIFSFLFFPLTLFSQTQQLTELETKFQQTQGDDKLIALDAYINTYSQVDRDRADSLLISFFQSNNPDTQNIFWTRLYFRLADVKLEGRDFEKSNALLDTALNLFKTTTPGNTTDFAKIFDLRGVIFQRYRKYDSAQHYFEKALTYAEEDGSNEILSKVHNALGTNFWYLRDYGSALKAYNKSLAIRKTLLDTSIIAQNYRNIGLTYKSIGDYPMALQYYRKALPFFNNGDGQREFGRLLNSIGLLYEELAEYDEAISFHKQSLSIREVLNDNIGRTASLDNLGSALIQKGNFGEALNHLLESEELKLGVEGDVRIYNTLANIGVCYDKLERHRLAKSYFERAILEARKVGEKRIVALVYNNLNLLYRDEGKYEQALNYGLESLKISKELGTAEAQSISNDFLSDTYKALGRFDKALEHKELFIEFQFQLFDQKTAAERSRLLVKYDFDKQQMALNQRESELEVLSDQSELMEAQRLNLIVAVVGLILIIVLLVFIYNVRLKKSRLESDLIKEKVKLTELSKENLDQKLAIKDFELTAYAEQLSQKNELITNFEEQLNIDKDKNLLDLASRVEGRSTSGISWEEFRLKFDQVHGDFIPRLNSRHEDLTNNELDISILLRINLANKDIASILGASYESVKKSVQRLYKKLNLSNAEDLRSYLLKI